VEALTAGWEEGDGRTLFLVGDPMQSIYQFREAEVGLFLRARDAGIGSVRLEALRLTRNFRSVPGLIAWTNAAFTGLFPESDDLRDSAVAFTPSLAGREETASGECVQLRLFPGDNRQAETAAITERIAALRASDPKSTVAILVAARTHATPIMMALEDRAVDA